MKNELENIYNTYYGLNGDMRYLPDGILVPGEDGIATDFEDKVYTEESVKIDELYKLNTGLLNLIQRISDFKREYKLNLK